MNAYTDSSVLLRIILGEPEPLAAWQSIDVAISSELIRLEALRTIDRARVQLGLPDAAVSRQRSEAIDAIDAIELVPLTSSVLERASEPFPTLVGSLDALHLATALLVRDQYDQLLFATHDHALAVAARAMGFVVEGA